jgi:hypothetical protein
MSPTASSAGAYADPRFSDQTLADLLRALRARAASRPDNPGLIACWPAVHEHQMPRACVELRRRGYLIESVAIAGRARSGWALRA